MNAKNKYNKIFNFAYFITLIEHIQGCLWVLIKIFWKFCRFNGKISEAAGLKGRNFDDVLQHNSTKEKILKIIIFYKNKINKSLIV